MRIDAAPESPIRQSNEQCWMLRRLHGMLLESRRRRPGMDRCELDVRTAGLLCGVLTRVTDHDSCGDTQRKKKQACPDHPCQERTWTRPPAPVPSPPAKFCFHVCVAVLRGSLWAVSLPPALPLRHGFRFVVCDVGFSQHGLTGATGRWLPTIFGQAVRKGLQGSARV